MYFMLIVYASPIITLAMQNPMNRAMPPRPATKPGNPNFSSGPCAKRPGWRASDLDSAILGRSHRSPIAKTRINAVVSLTREVLGIPQDYRIGIVPGSDTGAMEMALWNLLGSRGVDVLAWDVFGAEWVRDAAMELQLTDLRVFQAPYGQLPDLSQTSADRDIVFTWNGTSTGVRVPNADWISDARTGLTICDATSAAFAMALPWEKLDVTTWSWQKVLGGEGAHGVIVLSPRAIKRLTTYRPPRPIPKIFRLTDGNTVKEGIFTGDTINTPSMLVIEDALDGLAWAKSIGGVPALVRHGEANLDLLSNWIEKSKWASFLAEAPDTRSTTSLCVKVGEADVLRWPRMQQEALIRGVTEYLETEGAAYDIAAYRGVTIGFRLWAGATVATADLSVALDWLDYAYFIVKSRLAPGPTSQVSK